MANVPAQDPISPPADPIVPTTPEHVPDAQDDLPRAEAVVTIPGLGGCDCTLRVDTTPHSGDDERMVLLRILALWRTACGITSSRTQPKPFDDERQLLYKWLLVLNGG